MPKNHRITDSNFYMAFNKKRRRKDHINIHNRTSITNSIFYVSFNKKENDINVHNRASKSQNHHILASTWHSIETNKQKQKPKQNKEKQSENRIRLIPVTSSPRDGVCQPTPSLRSFFSKPNFLNPRSSPTFNSGAESMTSPGSSSESESAPAALAATDENTTVVAGEGGVGGRFPAGVSFPVAVIC